MSGHNVRLSVVIPTRNRSALLTRSIQTLLEQDFSSAEYEIVVVDDGSTDNTKAVVESFIDGREPEVTYVATDGSGINRARNMGVDLARAELIAFVDDDIEAPMTWASAVVAAGDRRPDAGCYGGRILVKPDRPLPRTCGAEMFATRFDAGPVEREVKKVFGTNLVIRRSAFDHVGRFEESLRYAGDEEEWEHRYTRGGGRIFYFPEIWVWHRRTHGDVRLSTLVKRSYRMGVGQVRFYELTRQPLHWPNEAWNLFAWLGHAGLRRCWGGVMHAARSLGRLRGLQIARREAKHRESVAAIASPIDSA